VGLLLNAFFGDRSIMSLDGVSTTIDGGFINYNWAALYKQVCYILATCSYTFVVTALIAKGIDMIPGLRLRAGPVDEALGMDEVEVGSDFSPLPSLRSDYLISSTENSPRIISSFVGTSLLLLSSCMITARTSHRAIVLWLLVIATDIPILVSMTLLGQKIHARPTFQRSMRKTKRCYEREFSLST